MDYIAHNIEEMKDIARDILAALPRGASSATMLTLSGDLGAGKTTFTQALARELGVEGRVTSPTFGIMCSYDISPCHSTPHLCHPALPLCHPELPPCHPELDSGSPRTSSRNNTSKIPNQVGNDSGECPFNTLIHIDAYRLEGEDDMKTLGWGELLKDPKNLIVIEWPERIESAVSKDAIRLTFEHVDETTRRIWL